MTAPLDAHVLDTLREELGDAAEVRELIDIYLDETPRLLEKLHAAAKRNDARTMGLVAHTLKSTSLTFGAHDLAKLFSEVETLCLTGSPRAAADRVHEADHKFGAVRAALQAFL